jgi:hypothetical protein
METYRVLSGSNHQSHRLAIDAKRSVESDVLALENGHMLFGCVCVKFDWFGFTGD